MLNTSLESEALSARIDQYSLLLCTLVPSTAHLELYSQETISSLSREVEALRERSRTLTVTNERLEHELEMNRHYGQTTEDRHRTPPLNEAPVSRGGNIESGHAEGLPVVRGSIDGHVSTTSSSALLNEKNVQVDYRGAVHVAKGPVRPDRCLCASDSYFDQVSQSAGGSYCWDISRLHL